MSIFSLIEFTLGICRCAVKNNNNKSVLIRKGFGFESPSKESL